MPRKSKEQRNAEIHALALARFDESFEATRVDRENALMARRFVNIRGAQWDWDDQKQFQNRMRMEIDHPIEGKVPNIGFAVKMMGTPQQVSRHPPLLGEHTNEVLEELGIAGNQLKALEDGGAFAA